MCAAALKNPAERPAKKFEPGLVGPPKANDLKAMLEKAAPVWSEMIAAMRERCSPFDVEWRSSKQLEFGRYCLLVHKDRTLLYLMPMAGQLLVGVVLDEMAYNLAQASDLRPAIKQMLAETKPTAEGRGIRFVVKTEADVAEVVTLARCVMEGT